MGPADQSSVDVNFDEERSAGPVFWAAYTAASAVQIAAVAAALTLRGRGRWVAALLGFAVVDFVYDAIETRLPLLRLPYRRLK